MKEYGLFKIHQKGCSLLTASPRKKDLVKLYNESTKEEKRYLLVAERG